jgi:hypothetical protein
MKLLVFHDYTNPDRVVPFDAEDFSLASPYLSGAALRTKSSDNPVYVHETPEEILRQLQELE